MHPACRCVKSYRATLRTDQDEWVLDPEEAVPLLRAGVVLGGERCAPMELEVLAREEVGAGQGRPREVRLRVSEGRYHLVKRALAACRGWVCALHREAIGGLRDDALPL